MHICGNYRVPKIVSVQITFAAKVKPGLGILMYKQWRKGSDVAQPSVLECSPLPGAPGLKAQGMRGGTESQQIHHHQFAVSIPAIRKESDFWCPPVREQRRVF